MEGENGNKIIASIFCVMFLVMAFPAAASADVGPKPSIVIDFEGITGQTYYATILSKAASNGPFSALSRSVLDDPNINPRDLFGGDEQEYPIFVKFFEFQDTDGYYFMDLFRNCTETNQFSWTYYPPSDFKILLYFPEKDSFIVSAEAYGRYAFDSYFTVSITKEIQYATISADGMEVKKSYNYRDEILSFIARVILTIAIELLIALFFMFWRKKQLLFILIVNLITQIGLNIALNLINYSYGSMMFAFAFVLLEFIILIVEARVYITFMKKLSETPIPNWKLITYAIVANAASFAAGLGLAIKMPGIF